VNDLAFVARAIELLASQGIDAWVSGGWGEELRGLIRPREHADVDVLHPAEDWDEVDALRLDWIDAKRFPWKRAFELEGIMVEIFLVQRDERGWYTQLARRRHDWPADLFAEAATLPVASTTALASLRHSYRVDVDAVA
jgi:hypothetical protein